MNRSTLLIATILLLQGMIFAQEAPSAGSWKWDIAEGRSLSLTGPNGTLWTLHHDPALAHFYFDPLRTGDGRNTTWVSPPDHPWHLGLWFSWKHLNGVNYWEIPKNATHPAGRTLIDNVEILETSRETARVRITQTLRPAEGAEPLARETVLLNIEIPRPDGSYAIDWCQQTTALADLEFESPRGYGGLSFRADKDWKDPEFLTARGASTAGMDGKVFLESPAPWMNVCATRQGQPVGVALFDHPSNPRPPTSWFLVNKMMGQDPAAQWPFFYANPALMAGQPVKLAQGGTLDLFYRILVHPGFRETSVIEREAAAFTKLTPPAP
jgi:hypothetical protein